jgi:hypothetical protein
VKKRQLQLQLQVLWLLRSACELAVAWPASLHPLAAAAAAAAECTRNGSGNGPSSKVGSSCAAAAGGLAGVSYDAADGSLKCGGWTEADVADAGIAAAQCWQQLWTVLVESAEGSSHSRLNGAVQEAICWQLHVLLAMKLVSPASKHAVSAQVMPLLLGRPQLPQQPPQQPLPPQQQPSTMMNDAQLALIMSLYTGERTATHADVAVRKQLLHACIATSEILCSSSSSRSKAARVSNTGTAYTASAAAFVAADHTNSSGNSTCLPELLLPAFLALLESPGLPSPGFNGCSGALQLAGPSSSSSSSSSLGFEHSAGNNMVWYSSSCWWWIDCRLEDHMRWLVTGQEHLQRKLAAAQLQQLFLASPEPLTDVINGVEEASTSPSGSSSSSSTEGASRRAQPGGGSCVAYGSGGSRLWWQCWCELADAAAEALCQVRQGGCCQVVIQSRTCCVSFTGT